MSAKGGAVRPVDSATHPPGHPRSRPPPERKSCLAEPARFAHFWVDTDIIPILPELQLKNSEKSACVVLPIVLRQFSICPLADSTA
jgi:hypothetical protein